MNPNFGIKPDFGVYFRLGSKTKFNI